MIKCPNCGSTTQVKLFDFVVGGNYNCYGLYKCSCGGYWCGDTPLSDQEVQNIIVEKKHQKYEKYN